MTFVHKKRYGQNFLTDINLLKAIVSDAGVDNNSEVLEIGPGLGSLTNELSLSAKKVVSYEIDRELIPILNTKFENSNVKIINDDIMNVTIDDIEENFDNKYVLVANLPYYITTPIIFKFIEQSKKIYRLVVMVQEEVAQKICAKAGDKNYGITSVLLDAVGDCKITRRVNRKLFTPIPNVDSAILRIDLHKKYDMDFKKFPSLVNNSFAMRRKTLVNNLIASYKLNREEAERYLLELGMPTTSRAENLTTDQFVKLYNLMFDNL